MQKNTTKNKPTGPSVLFFDLETSPLLGFSWRTFKTDLLSIEKDSGLLAFGYKINSGPVHVLSKRKYTERQLVKRLWKLFDENDVLVAHNGDRFDIRKANALFIKYGLKPPQPYRTVDTLKIARRVGAFDSNRMDYLTNLLFGEGKHETGLKLWLDCMKGNRKALKQMEDYCAQDVVLLEKLYKELRAWDTNHPNSNLYHETTHNCRVCQSKRTIKRGYAYTKVGIYQRWQCRDCGAWSQGEKVNKEKVIK